MNDTPKNSKPRWKGTRKPRSAGGSFTHTSRKAKKLKERMPSESFVPEMPIHMREPDDRMINPHEIPPGYEQEWDGFLGEYVLRRDISQDKNARKIVRFGGMVSVYEGQDLVYRALKSPVLAKI